ncbi:hypothetical protein BJX64DRAFT_24473 [Aspergillus heterothallicus]
MNWTGGRLRRHSGPNDKSRKQTFKRPTAATKGPQHITLFNGLAKTHEPEIRGGRELNDAAGQGQRAATTSLAPPQTLASQGSSTRLGQIKRQLLETTDWGVIGAARPVQASFTSQEELERFGKRRRLTDKDHERLNTNTSMTMVAMPGPRKEVPFQRGLGEDLEIRIDGRRLGQVVDRGSNERASSGDEVLPDVVSETYGRRFQRRDIVANRSGGPVQNRASSNTVPSQFGRHFEQHGHGPSRGSFLVSEATAPDMVSSRYGRRLGQPDRKRLTSVHEEASPDMMPSRYDRDLVQQGPIASGKIPSFDQRKYPNAVAQDSMVFGADENNRPDIAHIGEQGRGFTRSGSAMDERVSSHMVSSQSMLLDYEGSIASNNKASGQDSLASMNSAARSGSLSMISDVSQLCYVPDKLGMFGASDAYRIVPHHEDRSGSMDWVAAEPMESLRSQESSLIIQPPASPVRRRFTIDDQADAERHGVFSNSPTVSEPSSGQGLGESFSTSFLRSEGQRPQAGNQRGDAMKPPSTTMSPYTHFSWLPDPDRSGQRMQRSGTNNARSSLAPIREDQSSTNFSRSRRDVAPMTIFGQPVVIQDPGIRAGNHATSPLALRDREFDHAHAYNFSPEQELTSPPGFWSREVCEARTTHRPGPSRASINKATRLSCRSGHVSTFR